MARKVKYVLLATVLVALAAPMTLQADGGIANAWLAAYPDACQTLKDAATSCTLCHAGGSSRNAYGRDLGESDPSTIEDIDSDGDGRTNGKEIAECTLPGDSESFLPTDIETWGAIKALFR